ncbi:MAG TPA: hypothetical protein VGY99_18550 [Candidatus Binataceae bacterium]|jgi:hypothetical protein|nr:hypothetical protein [Candidatus Binataceae bacterium]
MKTSIMLLAAAALLLPLGGFVPSAAGQDLITNRQLAQSLAVRDVVAQPNGSISGTIVNHAGLTVRDVKLMINYAWVWNNDFRPGEDSPGRTVYITAPAAIPPHGQGSFTYQPPEPLSSENDGHFVPSVHVVGFTQMIPAG